MSNTDNASKEYSVSQYQSVGDSVTRGRARTRVREDGLTQIEPDDSTRVVQLRDLANYYTDTFGQYCPACARRDMAAALDAGTGFDVICIAMDQAAIVPRPSWAYARKILARCMAQGIHTESEYNVKQAQWTLSGGRRGHEQQF